VDFISFKVLFLFFLFLSFLFFSLLKYGIFIGPPGTGKTKTVIAIIGALISLKTLSEKKKILVCTQSNTAIDEIVLRISKFLFFFLSFPFHFEIFFLIFLILNSLLLLLFNFHRGVIGFDGLLQHAEVVRIGVMDQMCDEVKNNFSLDAKVEKECGNVIDNEEQGEIEKKISEIRGRLNEIDSKMKTYEKENPELFENMKTILKDDKKSLTVELNSFKAAQSKIEQNRKEVRIKILKKAQIICATLSASGFEVLRDLGQV